MKRRLQDLTDDQGEEEVRKEHDKATKKAMDDAKDGKHLNEGLRDYQREGVAWLAAQHVAGAGGGILGDDMGLGKTLQVLSFLQYLRDAKNEAGPHLVVCPLSVLPTWVTEAKRWCPSLRAVAFHGPEAERNASQARSPHAGHVRRPRDDVRDAHRGADHARREVPLPLPRPRRGAARQERLVAGVARRASYPNHRRVVADRHAAAEQPPGARALWSPSSSKTSSKPRARRRWTRRARRRSETTRRWRRRGRCCSPSCCAAPSRGAAQNSPAQDGDGGADPSVGLAEAVVQDPARRRAGPVREARLVQRDVGEGGARQRSVHRRADGV